MNNIWFTSDTHFCHNRDFIYEPRGFTNSDDMDAAIVENWNKVVKPNDAVYHLGDIALNDVHKAVNIIKELNGIIYIIRGNHDTDNKLQLLVDACWDKLRYHGWAEVIKHGKQSIYLSHYPTLTANHDEKHFNQHVINLHGHTHQRTNWLHADNPFMYHVGVDSHNCTPVHIDEILTDIRQRWNDIGSLPTSAKPQDTYPFNFNTPQSLKVIFEGDIK